MRAPARISDLTVSGESLAGPSVTTIRALAVLIPYRIKIGSRRSRRSQRSRPLQHGCEHAHTSAQFRGCAPGKAQHEPACGRMAHGKAAQPGDFETLHARTRGDPFVRFAGPQPADGPHSGRGMHHIQTPAHLVVGGIDQSRNPLSVNLAHTAHVVPEMSFEDEFGQDCLIE